MAGLRLLVGLAVAGAMAGGGGEMQPPSPPSPLPLSLPPPSLPSPPSPPPSHHSPRHGCCHHRYRHDYHVRDAFLFLSDCYRSRLSTPDHPHLRRKPSASHQLHPQPQKQQQKALPSRHPSPTENLHCIRQHRALIVRGGSNGEVDGEEEAGGEGLVIYSKTKKRRLSQPAPPANGSAFEWSSDGWEIQTWVSNHPDDENEDAYHVDPSANLSKLEQILQCDASPWSPSNFLLICFEQGSYFVERPLKIGFAKRPVQLMGHREPLLGSSESLRSDSRHTIIHAQLEAAERSRGILRHLRVLQRMESSIEPCVDIVGSRWAMDRCKVESLGGICVEVSGASQVALVSCSIGGVSYRTGHCQHGLWVSGTSHVQMRSCQVQFSSINGISLQEKARCSISQTALYKCTVGLSLLLPARARVASSTFMLNSHGAFYLGKRELNLTSNGCEMRPEALNMIDSYADQVPKGVARNLRSIFTLTKGEEQEQEQEQEQPRPHLRLENTQVHGPLWSSTDPPPSSLYEVSGSLEAKDDGTRHAGIAFSRIPLGANNHGFPHSARIITSDCLSSSEVEETPRTEVPRATNESNSTAAPPTPQAPAAPRRAASLPDSEGFSSGIHDSESEGPKQEVRPRTKGAKLQELLGADNFIPIDEPFSVELDESFSIEED